MTGRKCEKEKDEVKQEQDLVRTRADWARQRVVSKPRQARPVAADESKQVSQRAKDFEQD